MPRNVPAASNVENTPNGCRSSIARWNSRLQAVANGEFATAARYFMDNGLHRPYWDIQNELDSNLAVQLRMAFVAEQQELDADRIGFFLGARAGFDPPAMLVLLRKLGPDGSSDLLSTHPTQRLRLDQATAMLQAAEVVRGWADRGARRAATSK